MKKIILLAFALLCFAATASAAVVAVGRTVGYTAPSVSGKFVFALFKDNPVKILGQTTCNETRAAIATESVPVTVANLDKRAQDIILEKGHTVQINLVAGTIVEILEEQPAYYRCRVDLNGRGSYVYNFPRNAIRKIYGSVWYKVESNGQVGYVIASDIKV